MSAVSGIMPSSWQLAQCVCIISGAVAVEGFVPNFRSDDDQTVCPHKVQAVRPRVAQAARVASLVAGQDGAAVSSGTGRDKVSNQLGRWARQGWQVRQAASSVAGQGKAGEAASQLGR